jgi:hypothetical protein
MIDIEELLLINCFSEDSAEQLKATELFRVLLLLQNSATTSSFFKASQLAQICDLIKCKNREI